MEELSVAVGLILLLTGTWVYLILGLPVLRQALRRRQRAARALALALSVVTWVGVAAVLVDPINFHDEVGYVAMELDGGLAGPGPGQIALESTYGRQQLRELVGTERWWRMFLPRPLRPRCVTGEALLCERFEAYEQQPLSRVHWRPQTWLWALIPAVISYGLSGKLTRPQQAAQSSGAQPATATSRDNGIRH